MRAAHTKTRSKTTNDARSPRAREVATPSPGLMVVEDDAGVRNMLGEWLRYKGFSVLLAAGGDEALGMYGRHRETIDVVLMDVCMPDLDGPKTLSVLRAINPEVRCCFMSGGLGEYTEADLLERGGASLIRKPLDLDDLARTLAHLARPRALNSETV